MRRRWEEEVEIGDVVEPALYGWMSYYTYTNYCLSGVYTTNFLNKLEFYLGQILSLYQAKSLGKYLAQIFSFIEGQYLAQIKFQNV